MKHNDTATDVDAGITTAAIRKYLESVRDDSETKFTPKNELRYRRGRGIIEAMAATAEGSDYPSLELSMLDWSDVIFFMQMSNPVNQKTWWTEGDEPSQLLGEHVLLGAISDALMQRPQVQGP